MCAGGKTLSSISKEISTQYPNLSPEEVIDARNQFMSGNDTYQDQEGKSYNLTPAISSAINKNYKGDTDVSQRSQQRFSSTLEDIFKISDSHVNDAAKFVSIAGKVKGGIEAAKQQDTIGEFAAGCMFLYGEGVEKNNEIAAQLFERAARKGHVSAQYNIGNIYFEGLKNEPDYKAANHWWGLAASEGHIGALANLALLYSDGLGVNKNPEKAADLMERSAVGGNVQAEYNIGIMYRDGVGVDQNYETSAKWFEKAASHGFPDAKADLAVALALGRGVEVNLIESYKLANEAESFGIERASKIKESIKTYMTEDELNEALK